MTSDLTTRYIREEIAVTRRILTHVAAEQPLTYLAWIERARSVHTPCTKPECIICQHIRELVIPLPEELEEVAA